jgi:UDP-N-acetylmuramate dehydrogenase
MTPSIYPSLSKAFPTLVFEQDVSLAPFTYMKVGGPAQVLFKAQNREDLQSVLLWLNENEPQVPVTILGGASNVVVADEGIEGVVILNLTDASEVLESQARHELYGAEFERLARPADGYLMVESGLKTALLVRKALDAGLAGLEPFLGVPGTVGGAIFNNSHYTNELIGTYVEAVEVISEGKVIWLSQEECQFKYDHSRFHTTHEPILRVIFALAHGEKEQSFALIQEATQKRASTQPLGTANSGCMFKNAQLSPEQQVAYDGKETLSAGWLIDQAGLKGERVGGAVISQKHANFIINDDNATFSDVEALVKRVQEVVKEKFGIELEREVFFIGRK